jgi:hypothetical protein
LLRDALMHHFGWVKIKIYNHPTILNLKGISVKEN